MRTTKRAILLLLALAVAVTTLTLTVWARSRQPWRGLTLLSCGPVGGTDFTEVSGRVRNDTGRELAYTDIVLDLYDATGRKVGSVVDNSGNLRPGAIWEFHAVGSPTPAVGSSGENSSKVSASSSAGAANAGASSAAGGSGQSNSGITCRLRLLRGTP